MEKVFDPSIYTAAQLEEVVASRAEAVELLTKVVTKLSYVANFDFDNRKLKEFKASEVAVDAVMWGLHLHRRDALLAVHELISMATTNPKRPMSPSTREQYAQINAHTSHADLISKALKIKYERVMG